jgi:hypothetical protein
VNRDPRGRELHSAAQFQLSVSREGEGDATSFRLSWPEMRVGRERKDLVGARKRYLEICRTCGKRHARKTVAEEFHCSVSYLSSEGAFAPDPIPKRQQS